MDVAFGVRVDTEIGPVGFYRLVAVVTVDEPALEWDIVRLHRTPSHAFAAKGLNDVNDLRPDPPTRLGHACELVIKTVYQRFCRCFPEAIIWKKQTRMT